MTPHYAVQTPAGSLIAASLHEEKARQILYAMPSAANAKYDGQRNAILAHEPCFAAGGDATLKMTSEVTT